MSRTYVVVMVDAMEQDDGGKLASLSRGYWMVELKKLSIRAMVSRIHALLYHFLTNGITLKYHVSVL